MSIYLTWLRQGLRPELAQRVSAENLGLIIEDGAAFFETYNMLVSLVNNNPKYPWTMSVLNKDAWQLLPVNFRSVHFPKGFMKNIFTGCLFPIGQPYLLQAIDKHPYMRGVARISLRFIVFGDHPDNMLVMGIYTDNVSSSNDSRLGGTIRGRTHKSYLQGYNGTWITYGMSIPAPTMGFRIRHRY